MNLKSLQSSVLTLNPELRSLPRGSLLSQGTGVPVTELHWDLLALMPLSVWASVHGGETALALVSLPGHVISLEGVLVHAELCI